MADLDNVSNIDLNDDRSIAVRRNRRGSTGPNTHSRSNSQISTSRGVGLGISTPPETPKRSKKRVRFSEPGSDGRSSGLTPFIRRTSLSSTPPSKRRHSTPTTLSNRTAYDAPFSGTIQFAPLREVLDGRVKRRLRRHRLSEEVNNIAWEKKFEAKARQSELQRLRKELEAQDLEMQSMRDEQDIASQIEDESGTSITTNTKLSSKVEELEQRILELKAQLQQKEAEATTFEDPDWTMAAQDPFQEDDDDFMITNYDDDFRGSELFTTPTRLNASFPSPPATAPNTPRRPSSLISPRVQAILPPSDPEKDVLKDQLKALQCEIAKLTQAIALNDDNYSRLAEKLSTFIPLEESHDHSTVDSALDTVLTQLALTQSQSVERSAAFDALTSEISHLGFPASCGPEQIIETIATQFRQARLHLEYLIPGENIEGFENEKLLDMLISRIKVLLEKVKERDDTIDQYHEQEILLRQQLNTRVDALQDVQKELVLANSVVGDLRSEIQEQQTGNERLQTALEGYRAEVASLEKLIERIEKEGSENEDGLRREIITAQERLQDEILAHDTTKAGDEGREIMIMELEKRLNAALQASEAVKIEMAALGTSRDAIVQEKEATIKGMKASGLERERQHGNALALRDARVLELRTEIQRVNDALNAAHTTILGLRKEIRDLDAEKTKGQVTIQDTHEQLNRVLEGLVNGYVAVQGPVRATEVNEGSTPMEAASSIHKPVVRRGGFLSGHLAKKGGKKRRRYDSGIGFLEDDQEEDGMVV